MTLLTQTIVNNKEEDHLCNNVKFQIVFIQKKVILLLVRNLLVMYFKMSYKSINHLN